MRKKREDCPKILIVNLQIFIIFFSIISFTNIISEVSFVSAQNLLPTPVTESNQIRDISLRKTYKLNGVSGEFTFSRVKQVGGNYRALATYTDGKQSSVLLTKKQVASLIEQGELVPGKAPVERGFFGLFKTTNPLAGHLLEGLGWSLMVVGAIQLIGGLFGADKSTTKALSLGAFAGIMSYKSLLGIGETKNLLFDKSSFLYKQAGLIGVGIGVAVFLLTYKKEKKQIVQFQCLPYEPPLGGNDCEVCNEDEFRPCSEYRCKSLGQACELVNPGTEEEKCVWVSRDDVASPTITPWPEALSEDHSYVNHDTRPPSLGTKIVRDSVSNGCIQAFTPLEFGILTNEPAQCKIDLEHKDSYDEMQFFFGETNYLIEEHSQTMSLPSPDSINAEAPELENDGIYDLYVRCRDANGNLNEDEFVFSFCVDPSPDTTPPVVVDTSIENGAPVAFGVGEIDLSVFVNEPSECKWSVQDKNYNDMENAMECATSVTEINAQQLYACTTTLTGIKDREENKYYFRCKDQPSKPDSERNVNVQSFDFSLMGTQPLNIIDVSPNDETISGSTEVVSVDLTLETSNGANEGEAICYFSDTGDDGSFITMFETNNFEHRQTLSLAGGDYEYHFRCVDAGGNSDNATTSFNVFVDTQAPQVTRAYRELDALKIVTNEDAECAYSLNSCNFVFDEGIALIYSNPSIRTNHFSPWEPNLVYYIKCKDDFGNQPGPSQCSLTASATNIV